MDNQEKKWKVSFVDASKNRTEVKIEITYRNEYKELTMSGDYGGGGGQIVDIINPANEPQKRLIKMWNEFHLNGMNAGTPRQQAVIEKMESEGGKYEYEAACLYLSAYDRDGQPLTVLDKMRIDKEISAVKTGFADLNKQIFLLLLFAV